MIAHIIIQDDLDRPALRAQNGATSSNEIEWNDSKIIHMILLMQQSAITHQNRRDQSGDLPSANLSSK